MGYEEIPHISLGPVTVEQASVVAASAIHHVLFAKGQIDQPITTLRKQKSRVDPSSGRAGMTLSARRAQRGVDSMLKALHQTQHDIHTVLQQASARGTKDSVVILLRLGRSPLTAAKQQYFIVLQGLRYLQSEQDLNSAPPKRQVFGSKSSSEGRGSSSGRSAALERKLVRFLLSHSGHDGQLGRALQTEVGPTRTQIFLSGGANESVLPLSQWTQKRSLKASLQQVYEGDPFDGYEASNAQHHGSASTFLSSTSKENEEDDDIATLSQALSPLKRRAKSAHTPSKCVDDECSLRSPPALSPSIGILDRNRTTLAHSSDLPGDDVDVRRQNRHMARIAGRRQQSKTQRPLLGRLTSNKVSTRKGPLSAAFAIDFKHRNMADEHTPSSEAEPPNTDTWLGTNNCLRACTS